MMNQSSRANASVRLAYTSTNVTTSAYVTLVAATADKTDALSLFDSSGQTLYFAVGAAGAEVDMFIIPPGGLDTPIPVKIAAGSRIALKAISATASAGEIDVNFFKN